MNCLKPFFLMLCVVCFLSSCGGANLQPQSPTLTNKSINGSDFVYTYSDGSTVRKLIAATTIPTWAFDHVTKTTIYVLFDGLSDAISETVPPTSASTYADNVQTVTTTYGDGHSTDAANAAVSNSVEWATDHITKTTTYTFEDSETNLVVTEVNPTSASTYVGNVQTVTTTYGDGHSTDVSNSAVSFALTWGSGYTTEITTFTFPDLSTHAVADPVAPTTYIKTSNVLLNEEKVVDAMSLGLDLAGTVTNTTDSYGYARRNVTITDLTPINTDYSSTATLAYNNDGTIKKISVNANGKILTWESGTDRLENFVDDTYGMGIVLASKQPENLSGNLALFINPAVVNTLGFQYQSFGGWAVADDHSNNTWTGELHSMSIGTPTARAAIPLAGTDTFRGYTTGNYVAGDMLQPTVSELSVNVNFSTNDVELNTTNTRMFNNYLKDPVEDLDITGTLTYSYTTNSFAGGATTTNGMTGNASGRFYGPAAEEIGGVFSLNDGALTSYIGAFGGVR